MAGGGYQPGAGRKHKGLSKREITLTATSAGLSPLEYMLTVMRNPKADAVRRDRMAIAAAPFCHGRMSDEYSYVGKKERQSEAAKVAGVGTEWEADLMRVMPADKPN